MRTIGCKVDDELFNTINDLDISNSEFLRKAINHYLKHLKEKRLTKVNHKKNFSEYEMLCKTLDSIKNNIKQSEEF